jgi:polyisoprenoid-binding protein YceI
VNAAGSVYRGLRTSRIFQDMKNTNEVTLWTLDPIHTTVGFSVRHLMITNVHGVFEKVAGTVHYDAARPESSSIEVTIQAESIHTREATRDGHLRSPDFLDAANHPTLTFQSTHVRGGTAGALEIDGALTIRGTTRPITVHVGEVTSEHPDFQGKPRIGASATAKLRRSDFGMTFNKVLEAGGIGIGDEVTISLDVSLMKTA